MTRRFGRRLAGSRGQSLLEFALVLPLLVMVVLGVVELGYALIDAHVVTKMSREGSNLISRDTTLQDAVTTMRSMSGGPVNFDDGSSTLILSVILKVATVGSANFDRPVLYQRYTYGSYPGASVLTMAGSGAFQGAPDYKAVNADNNPGLQVTNLAPNLLVTRGGMLYVAEIYSRHQLLTPLGQFGIPVPSTLYSIAYF